MFSKYIILLLQIILVVAGIIVFSFFDPFNIFNTKKLKVASTTTIIENVRDIGELITAEYYGEVIQSSTDSVVITIQNLQDSVKKKISIFSEDVADALGEINTEHSGKNEIRKAKHVLQFFSAEYPELQNHSLYPHYLALMEIKLKTKNIRAQREKNILYEVFKQIKDNKQIQFGALEVPEEYLEKHFGLSKKEMKSMVRNKLVILGRGWVKAGIDFKHFDNDDIRYVEGSSKILLMRHKARVISATINPWFMPKKKITGFEYLFIGKSFKKSDDPGQLERVKRVKHECLMTLKQQAMTAGILAQAEKNAETSLSGFFSLLMGKPVTVEIFGHPLDAYRTEFEGSDNILSATEIPSVDSLVTVYMDSALFSTVKFAYILKEMPTENVPQQIKELSWEEQTLYLTIAKDSLYTSAEQKRMHEFENRQASDKDYLYYVLNARREELTGLQTLDTLDSDTDLNMSKLRKFLGAKIRDEEFTKSRTDNLKVLQNALNGLRREVNVKP